MLDRCKAKMNHRFFACNSDLSAVVKPQLELADHGVERSSTPPIVLRPSDKRSSADENVRKESLVLWLINLLCTYISVPTHASSVQPSPHCFLPTYTSTQLTPHLISQLTFHPNPLCYLCASSIVCSSLQPI